jgi:hypothetical protein
MPGPGQPVENSPRGRTTRGRASDTLAPNYAILLITTRSCVAFCGKRFWPFGGVVLLYSGEAWRWLALASAAQLGGRWTMPTHARLWIARRQAGVCSTAVHCSCMQCAAAALVERRLTGVRVVRRCDAARCNALVHTAHGEQHATGTPRRCATRSEVNRARPGQLQLGVRYDASMPRAHVPTAVCLCRLSLPRVRMLSAARGTPPGAPGHTVAVFLDDALAAVSGVRRSVARALAAREAVTTRLLQGARRKRHGHASVILV